MGSPPTSWGLGLHPPMPASKASGGARALARRPAPWWLRPGDHGAGNPVEQRPAVRALLKPGRSPMPDTTRDFCIERRSEVIEYCDERYGADKVAQIITFQRNDLEGGAQGCGPVLDIPYGIADASPS